MSESPLGEAPQDRDSMTPLQRVLMDRARQQAALAQVKPPRRPFQTLVSIVLAFVAVFIVFGAINAFLATMERAMHTMDEQEKAQEAVREAERRKAPMPAYVVPEDDKNAVGK